jgi:hypothetical protein
MLLHRFSAYGYPVQQYNLRFLIRKGISFNGPKYIYGNFALYAVAALFIFFYKISSVPMELESASLPELSELYLSDLRRKLTNALERVNNGTGQTGRIEQTGQTE